MSHHRDPDHAESSASMSPALADLLLAALDVPEDQQRRYIEQACVDDPALRDEALACLDLELGDFLAQPAAQWVSEPSEDTATLGSLNTTRLDRRDARSSDSHSHSSLESPAAVDLRDLLEQPDRLGNYEIIDSVGVGGMGQVYLGRDPRLDRRVAIKTLPTEMLAHPTALQRFEREAKVLATLNHPNIVTIYSVEEDQGIPFLTMELIEGQTLSQHITQSGLPVDQLLDLATTKASALAAAHDRGVVHRDLKPANVMITDDGRVKILDFGIATAPEDPEQRALSAPGMMIGTVPYMAPEQLEGEPADRRSDLFSLGVLLYQVATGQHPFPADGFSARVLAILDTEPVPLSTLRSDLPAEFVAIVERCLQKAPDDRFQSTDGLHTELHRLQQTRLANRILSSQSGLPALVLRRPRWLLVAAASAIAIAVALGLAAWLRSAPTEGVASPTAAAQPIRPRTGLTVLFFRNLTGDPSSEWLSTGITELVVTDLSQIPDLKVLPIAEFYRLLGDEAGGDPADLADEFLRQGTDGVESTAVLRGSFARLGETLRIAYTLERPDSSEILVSRSIEDSGEASLFTLIDDLSATVRRELAVQRSEQGPETVTDATTASVAAWQAFAEAQSLYLEQAQPEAAIEQFEQALKIDPNFALAHVKLAKIHQSLGHDAEARSYAHSAFELAERLPLYTRFDVEGGYYGTTWAMTGRAIETYDLALKIYPHASGWRNNLARRYAFFERYDEAIEEFEHLIADGRNYWGNFSGAAVAHSALGDFETGLELLRQRVAQGPDHWLLRYSMAWQLTEWGRLEEAAEAFEQVATMRPNTPQLHYGRWRLQVLKEDWPQADREARTLRQFEDSFAQWRGNVSLARNALYRGHATQAEAALRAAIARSTAADRALARCFLAELLLTLGDARSALEEARLAQQEGHQQWPELRAQFLAALAQQRLGRDSFADQLRESLRQHWRSQPNAVEERQLHHLTGLLAIAEDDLETGLRELRRAAAMLPTRGVEFSWHVFPDHVPIWTDLGQAEMIAGRPRAAVEWLSKAALSGTEHLEQPLAYVRSLYLKGLAHQQLAEEAEARVAFDRFLDFWRAGELRPEWLANAHGE